MGRASVLGSIQFTLSKDTTCKTSSAMIMNGHIIGKQCCCWTGHITTKLNLWNTSMAETKKRRSLALVMEKMCAYFHLVVLNLFESKITNNGLTDISQVSVWLIKMISTVRNSYIYQLINNYLTRWKLHQINHVFVIILLPVNTRRLSKYSLHLYNGTISCREELIRLLYGTMVLINAWKP